MATLSSSSSRTQIEDAYDDNASYEEDDSPAKAKIFVTACRLLLRQLARSVENSRGDQSQKIELDLAVYQKEMQTAQGWLASNASDSSQVVHHGFDGWKT